MPESRGEWLVFTAGAAVIAALVFVAVRARHHTHAVAAAVSQTVAHTVTKPAHTAPAPARTTSASGVPVRKDKKPKPPVAREVALTLTATGGSSWVEVRASSATGPILYSGTLTSGTKKVFRSRSRLWARFGGAANLAVALGGRPLHVPTGTYDVLFDRRRFRVLSTG